MKTYNIMEVIKLPTNTIIKGDKKGILLKIKETEYGDKYIERLDKKQCLALIDFWINDTYRIVI